MTLRAGFGSADITPALPCDIDGFAGRTQPAVGVAEPVLARVVVFTSGRSVAVVAVCDVLGFRIEDSVRLEHAAARAAGCPVGNVFIACTHTHSGPMSQPLGECFRFDPKYITLVRRKLVEAVKTACADLSAVIIAHAGSVKATGLGEFRCALSEPGRERWPGMLSAWRLVRERGGPITFWHLGVHQYLLGGQSRVIHPDYPGTACGMIERDAGGHALFLPGCAGDVTPIPQMLDSMKELGRYSRRVATGVEAALKKGAPVAVEPLRAGVISPRIRYGFEPNLKQVLADNRPPRADDSKHDRNLRRWARLWRQGQLPTSAHFRTHLLQLGGVLLLGMPAELFCDTGTEITAALKNIRVLPTAHTGGNIGYLCRPFAYKHHTYESQAHVWYGTAGAVVPGTEAKVRRTAVRAARVLTRR
ncbi:MAG: hypothetical protein K8S99_03185 [Planctomycetes bacterium]|nr:hypothetical protein [Planctomycetota bacterium]